MVLYRSEIEISLRAMAKSAGAMIQQMAPGDSLDFPLPENVYLRRETYRKIAAQCHRVLGPGNYRVTAAGDKVVVERRAGRFKSACYRPFKYRTAT